MAAIGPKRADGTYRARYRDRAGKEHARHFKRRVDAQRWLDETTTSLVTGAYVAPGAGRITFREYAEAWRAVQIHRAGTVVQVEGALRRRVYPVIGDRPLESIVPSDIQQLVKRLERELSPASVIVTYRHVATIFKAASRDRRIALSPCDGIRLLKIVKKPVAPMATSDIQSLAEAVPKRYRAMVILAAGTGLRQGEIFGLTLDGGTPGSCLNGRSSPAVTTRSLGATRMMAHSRGVARPLVPRPIGASFHPRAGRQPERCCVGLAALGWGSSSVSPLM